MINSTSQTTLPSMTNLTQLQEHTEDLITNNPYIAEALQKDLFTIYQNGQLIGQLMGRLQIATMMSQLGYHTDFITQLTGLKETDLAQ